MNIVFTVNEAAADYILKSLALRPFGEVADLVNDLVRQAQAQQAQAQQAQAQSVSTN